MNWKGKVSLDTLYGSVKVTGGYDMFDPTIGVRDINNNGHYLLVKTPGGSYEVYTFLGGANGPEWTIAGGLNQAETDYVTSLSNGGPDDEEGGGDDEGGKPPDFGPTGPVYTPLDPAGIPERNYTNFYPQSYMPADPAYPTMGLLSNPATQPGLQGTDLYQPWSAKYGQNVAPASLWNYQPPSGLDVAAGPKVTFQK